MSVPEHILVYISLLLAVFSKHDENVSLNY